MRYQGDVRVATTTDRAAVISTTVAAFRADSALRYFFPDDETYDRLAGMFFGYLFDKRLPHGTVWVTDGCEAASLWSPPSAWGNDADEHLGLALRSNMLSAIGPGAAGRLETYERSVDTALPADESYWYLGVLATHPDHVGLGHGAAVMNAGLAHARQHGGAAYLETVNPANVPYYERHGWTVTTQLDHPFPVWILRQA